MILDSKMIEALIFSKFNATPRFTQDSPVYPDVWRCYFEHRKELSDFRADLILTPRYDSSAVALLKSLNGLLKNSNPVTDKYSLATNGDSVVARLTLDELVSLTLPMTNWWRKYFLNPKKQFDEHRKWMRQLLGAIYTASLENNEQVDNELLDWEAVFSENYKSNFSGIENIFPSGKPVLWSVNRNRKATLSVSKSVPATKADASRRLFDVDGTGITWAVLDSGIDGKHPAFRKRDPKTGVLFPEALGAIDDPDSNHTRVVATYDFTNFREIISNSYLGSFNNTDNSQRDMLGILSSDQDDKMLTKGDIGKYMKDMGRALNAGRQLDWSIAAPLLRIPHNVDQYLPPKHSHGTHVAGILAANLLAEDEADSIIGMCPGIELYDIRVINTDGNGEEFNILAAMNFIRWLNNQKEVLTIQGVNMSISMKHEVASYACGQTPICVGCEKLVAEGVVVVASAGNLGQALFQDQTGESSMGFRTVNITDPGNARKIITVGSTHRDRPHTYGVSYFSSKGPTGDGRVKPDLVAPGEKIVSTSLEDGEERLDGTSMAAPHVSGAAALMMSKHIELIGDPERIKEILCSTATDLGRERYFQGCGLVDVLRAMQAV
jgi:serine protease AprX